MITLTAIIKCKSGSEEHIRLALLAVGQYAQKHESGTQTYFITSGSDQGVFVTHERYVDQGALDAHNNGLAAKDFFVAAEGHIESVAIYIGTEIFP
jgi:quinol monooxygenase YgiN